jgi:hypothetical protein
LTDQFKHKRLVNSFDQLALDDFLIPLADGNEEVCPMGQCLLDSVVLGANYWRTCHKMLALLEGLLGLYFF